jgi:hypothetical protein
MAKVTSYFWISARGRQTLGDKGVVRLEAIHREPQDCLFVDDSLTNVRVAKGVGIPGIRFVNAGQLRAELETTP